MYRHQNPVYASPLPHTRYMPRPSPYCRFCHRTTLGEQFRSLNSSFYSFIHSPVPLSLLGPNILLSALFSNTLSQCSSHNVSNQVSHPYQATIKNTVQYILIFIFLDSKLRQTVLHWMITSILGLQSALNFFLNRISICCGCSQIFEFFHPFKWTSAFVLHSDLKTWPYTEYYQHLLLVQSAY